jgi:hypothetical protein
MAVATFTRVYQHGAGPEHPATPEFVANVLRGMREAADGPIPFAVLLKMDDGSTVTARPKARR